MFSELAVWEKGRVIDLIWHAKLSRIKKVMRFILAMVEAGVLNRSIRISSRPLTVELAWVIGTIESLQLQSCFFGWDYSQLENESIEILSREKRYLKKTKLRDFHNCQHHFIFRFIQIPPCFPVPRSNDHDFRKSRRRRCKIFTHLHIRFSSVLFFLLDHVRRRINRSIRHHGQTHVHRFSNVRCWRLPVRRNALSWFCHDLPVRRYEFPDLRYNFHELDDCVAEWQFPKDLW